MLFKYTYDDVLQKFKDRGYTLVSTEYTDRMQKLKYICPNGHHGTVTFKNFINRNSGCRKCALSKPRKKYSNRKKQEKYTIEYIKQVFENEGYKIFNKEYKNAKTKIEYKCPKGHYGTILFYSFYKSGCRCNKCKYDTLLLQFRHDYNKIKAEFSNLGFNLLSTNYSPNEPLKFICPSGHNTEMNYYAWTKSEYKCYLCYLNILQKSKAFTYDEVKKIFENKNCILLTDNYINAKQKLEYLCPMNHKTSTTLDGFNRVTTVVCIICSKTQKYTIDEIKDEFAKINYTLLSKEYVNAKKPLHFKCDQGHEHYISWTHFDRGQRCVYCIYNRGTQACQSYLQTINLKYVFEKKFPLCKNKRQLPFDIFVDNKFLIEFDGRQHFNIVDYFGGVKEYLYRVQNDHIKNHYCITNNIPLLRISYKEIKQIPTIIDSFIKTLNNLNKDTPLIKFSNEILYKHHISIYNKLTNPSARTLSNYKKTTK